MRDEVVNSGPVTGGHYRVSVFVPWCTDFCTQEVCVYNCPVLSRPVFNASWTIFFRSFLPPASLIAPLIDNPVYGETLSVQFIFVFHIQCRSFSPFPDTWTFNDVSTVLHFLLFSCSTGTQNSARLI